MHLSDLTGSTADALRGAGAMLTDMMTPTLRLGVTGLSRAGQDGLHHGTHPQSRLRRPAAFFAQAEGRIERAYLEPQPDDAVPRFDYEGHWVLSGGTRRNGPKARGA